MNIEKLFSTKERITILKHVLFKEEKINVSTSAKEAQVSKGLVSKFFVILKREKILKKEKNKLFVDNTIQTKTLKIFLTINSIDTNIFKKFPFIKAVGVYGSAVKGTNTGASDIDLWIYGKKAKEEEYAILSNKLKKSNPQINIVLLTKEKIMDLQKKDILFYHTLVLGSITIYGDDLLNVQL